MVWLNTVSPALIVKVAPTSATSVSRNATALNLSRPPTSQRMPLVSLLSSQLRVDAGGVVATPDPGVVGAHLQLGPAVDRRMAGPDAAEAAEGADIGVGGIGVAPETPSQAWWPSKVSVLDAAIFLWSAASEAPDWKAWSAAWAADAWLRSK